MSIKDFFKRIKFIFRLDEDYIVNLIDEMKYELADELKTLPIPKIKTVDETLDALIAQKVSFCRFGDGEINLINGRDIPFQKSSSTLQKRLIEVLTCQDDDLFIGIPRVCFYSKQNILPLSRHFWRKKGKRFRDAILPYLDMKQQYYDAGTTLAYSYIEYDFDNYFSKLRSLWQNRDIVVICGQTVFDKIEHNIFDNAKSLEYQYAPSMNAFESYADIYQKALQIAKDKLIIAILGPTAKCLCYDLHKAGYQALDLGHVAKSYDLFKKNIPLSQTYNQFYKPD